MRCLIVSTNRVLNPYPVYPLGAALVTGALQAAGHDCRHYDFLAGGGVTGLKQAMTEHQPELVGLSIRNIDTVDSTAPDAFLSDVLEIMHIVRQHTRATVVVGGPAFSILPDALMASLRPDYGIIGEGETLLPWLADRLQQGRPPKERILKASCDKNPWRPVSYQQEIAEYYLQHGGMLSIQTKRGCPYRCGYCSYPMLEGKKYRYRDPQEVAEDFARATKDFGARYIFFTDSVFNDAKQRYLAIAEALIRAGNTTPWCAFFRPQKMNKENLRLLQRAGLSSMEIGTDASTDKTLAALGKGFGFSEVEHTNALALELGIPCVHFVIFGGPGEDETTVRQGLANIERLGQSAVFAYSGIRILPDTAIYRQALKEKQIAPTHDLVDPVFYFSPDIKKERMEQIISNAWKGRHNRIFPGSRLQPIVDRLHQRGHIGPLWELIGTGIEPRQHLDKTVVT